MNDNNDKRGMYSIGKVDNDALVNDLIKLTKKKEINIYDVLDFTENEIQNNKFEYYDRNATKTRLKENASYIVFNTGEKFAGDGSDIYGYFIRVDKYQFKGVKLDSYAKIIGKIKYNTSFYRLGLMTFDNLELAISFFEELHNELLPGERWCFNNDIEAGAGARKVKYPILENYIRYVYQKLMNDYVDQTNPDNINKDKLKFSTNGKYVLFNTGLLNRFVQDIFIVGEKYTKSNGFIELKNPVVETSKINLISKYNFENRIELPEIVSFFESLDQVIFKADLDDIDISSVKYRHIIDDNHKRWPEKYKKYIENEGYNVQYNEEIFASDLKMAIEKAVKIAKRNYKYVVPQYRPKENSIQFLMPIYLDNKFGNAPDFALVLSFHPESNLYKAETILTLDAAYNNARLIAKPDDLWLNPMQIKYNDSEYNTESEDSEDIEAVENDVLSKTTEHSTIEEQSEDNFAPNDRNTRSPDDLASMNSETRNISVKEITSSKSKNEVAKDRNSKESSDKKKDYVGDYIRNRKDWDKSKHTSSSNSGSSKYDNKTKAKSSSKTTQKKSILDLLKKK